MVIRIKKEERMHKKILLISSIILIGTIGLGLCTDKVPENMVFVKGGIFHMGTDKIGNDEEPIHQVTLNRFYIGKFEVTQKEWEAVMGNNPSIFKGDELPVDNINWYMAIEFCNKKSHQEGRSPCYTGSGDNITCNFEADGYRLPTEAEWEFACRGGLKSGNYKYSGSDNPDEVAWHELNSGDKTQPVGTKKANELGIYDMSGNMWEWCWDWYAADYYKGSPVNNPQGPSSGNKRAYRGGGIVGQIQWLRSSARYNLEPTYKSFDMGLRIAKNTSGKEPGNMVLVERGPFLMGSNDGGGGERPAHQVTLNSFYIGKFEVPQEEWRAVMGKNPSSWLGAKSPVDSISWYDVVEYCNKRSRMEGLNPCYSGSGDDIICNFGANGYRLPTEAEWEYASRGGEASQNYKYSGSNNLDEVGWYKGNSTFHTEPVGQKKANELGIYDMSGNLWEWCWDWFDSEYYKKSPLQNPPGPSSGLRRVNRGGSIINTEDIVLTTYRLCSKPNYLSRNIGLRVVRNAE
jgi:sulfatase modifying factor 1